MATDNITPTGPRPTYLDMSAPAGVKKICVARAVALKCSGRVVTGVFTWIGTSWRTATITGLVRELPAEISDRDLRAAYTAAVKARRAEGL